MKKLVKLLIPLLPLIVPLQTDAQKPYRLRSVVCIGGSSGIVLSDGHQYYIQQSIGQPGIAGLAENKNLQLRQGFIQPVAGSLKNIEAGSIQASVFPNPLSDNIIISFSEQISDFLYVSIYDLDGRIIYFRKHEPSSLLTIDAGNLASGVYIMRVSSATKYLSIKVIKL